MPIIIMCDFQSEVVILFRTVKHERGLRIKIRIIPRGCYAYWDGDGIADVETCVLNSNKQGEETTLEIVKLVGFMRSTQ